MMNKLFVPLLVAGVIALAGCGGRNAAKPETDATATAASGSAQGSGVDSGAATASGVGADQASGATGAAAASERIIYFDFDSSDIRPEFASTVTSHARALAGNASIRVRLEGHTDERGSREYNVGLGERRAQAVRRALLLQGVTETQLSTVSYGEEKPSQGGSTEEAWARNRRVEIVYLN